MDNKKAITILQAVRANTVNALIAKVAIREALDMAIDALEKQEQDRWIPVTERLPEEDCDCRVTVKNDLGIYVFDCSYNKGEKRFESWYPYQDDFMPIPDVTAWKPIEAPYQEDKA